MPCCLLGICSRTIVAQFPAISLYRRVLKAAPVSARTLGDHLRITRIDRKLTQAQVAQLMAVAHQTVRKWEANLTGITPAHRVKIIRFLGYDPFRNSRKSNRRP